jgi:hypothetical protein
MLVQERRAAMKENQAVQRALSRHGFRSGAEVFCNDWDVYNLGHPYLEPFYDYGGYMLLDSEYAAQRPIPADWRSFRFFIQVRGLPGPRPRGRKIFSGPRLDVYFAG